MDLATIEELARRYSRRRAELAAEVRGLNEGIAGLKRKRLPLVKQAARHAALAKGMLLEAVASHPELFAKPKTRIFDDIRVGWRKAKGKVQIADVATTIKLIKRHLADIADTLIKVKESVIKTAVANLPGSDLKRIGATVADTADEPLVEPTDGEIEKLVDALLEDGAAARGARAAEEDE